MSGVIRVQRPPQQYPQYPQTSQTPQIPPKKKRTGLIIGIIIGVILLIIIIVVIILLLRRGSNKSTTTKCTTNANCSGGTVCDISTGACVTCLSDANCDDPTPVCNTSTKKCVGCLADTDCTGGLICKNNTCVAPPCTTNTDCASSPDVPICDTTKGKCVECKVNSDCSGLDQCKNNVCMPPQCTFVGDLACTGATPACDIDSLTCVQCIDDSTCPDPKVCNLDTHTCTGCIAFPSPLTVTITNTAITKSLNVTFPKNLDANGSKIYVSRTSGFTATTAEKSFDSPSGVGKQILAADLAPIPLETGQTWYIRASNILTGCGEGPLCPEVSIVFDCIDALSVDGFLVSADSTAFDGTKLDFHIPNPGKNFEIRAYNTPFPEEQAIGSVTGNTSAFWLNIPISNFSISPPPIPGQILYFRIAQQSTSGCFCEFGDPFAHRLATCSPHASPTGPISANIIGSNVYINVEIGIYVTDVVVYASKIPNFSLIDTPFSTIPVGSFVSGTTPFNASNFTPPISFVSGEKWYFVIVDKNGCGEGRRTNNNNTGEMMAIVP